MIKLKNCYRLIRYGMAVSAAWLSVSAMAQAQPAQALINEFEVLNMAMAVDAKCNNLDPLSRLAARLGAADRQALLLEITEINSEQLTTFSRKFDQAVAGATCDQLAGAPKPLSAQRAAQWQRDVYLAFWSSFISRIVFERQFSNKPDSTLACGSLDDASVHSTSEVMMDAYFRLKDEPGFAVLRTKLSARLTELRASCLTRDPKLENSSEMQMLKAVIAQVENAGKS